MSTVKSVSGFAVEVLKLVPFLTENHWPFLVRYFRFSYCRTWFRTSYLCTINFRFLRSARTFSPALSAPVDEISFKSTWVSSWIATAWMVELSGRSICYNSERWVKRTSLTRPSPSFPIHPFLNARPCPTFAVSSPTFFLS